MVEYAWPRPCLPSRVDQRDAQAAPSAGREAEQVDNGQRAAGAPADDRDDRPAVAGKIGGVHAFTITQYVDRINS